MRGTVRAVTMPFGTRPAGFFSPLPAGDGATARLPPARAPVSVR
ncbi:MAG: hypothetical protein OXU61_03405 [Gammaproteobacteria bacterium]|nr:hypothetical protein [Gammaproteobacteria bacterium]